MLFYCRQDYFNFKTNGMILKNYLSAHFFGNVFYNIKSKSGTLFIAAVVPTIKFIKDKRHIFIWNTLAVIPKMQDNIFIFHCKKHFNICLCIFSRIVNNVFAKLCESVFICIDKRRKIGFPKNHIFPFRRNFIYNALRKGAYFYIFGSKFKLVKIGN